MNLVTIILIALGLAMDAFAVSVASGFSAKRLHLRHALRMAAAFGIFQALMPVAGWLAGTGLRSFMTGIDHWVAFGLLSAIGGKMISESTKLDDSEKSSNPFASPTLFVLAVATSIDAFAVGISLSMIGIAIAAPAAIIGAVTFALSLGGTYIGERFGHLFERKLELIGGLILIGIGVKILVEHLA